MPRRRTAETNCHAYCHRVCRSVRKCTEVKTAKSVCTEVYRSVWALRRLNGVQEVASSVAEQSEDAKRPELHLAAPISRKPTDNVGFRASRT